MSRSHDPNLVVSGLITASASHLEAWMRDIGFNIKASSCACNNKKVTELTGLCLLMMSVS